VSPEGQARGLKAVIGKKIFRLFGVAPEEAPAIVCVLREAIILPQSGEIAKRKSSLSLKRRSASCAKTRINICTAHPKQGRIRRPQLTENGGTDRAPGIRNNKRGTLPRPCCEIIPLERRKKRKRREKEVIRRFDPGDQASSVQSEKKCGTEKVAAR